VRSLPVGAASVIEQEQIHHFSLPESFQEQELTPFHDVPKNWLTKLGDLHAAALQQQKTKPAAVAITRDTKKRTLTKLSKSDAAKVEEKLTTWHCIEAHASNLYHEASPRMTCKFRNLYYETSGKKSAGWFAVHTLKGNTSRPPSMSAGVGSSFNDCHYDLREIKHLSLEDFQAYLLENDVKQEDHHGITLPFWPLYHFNIGHGLFDGMYPAFVSVMQHGDQDMPFRPLILGGRLPEIAEKCPVCFTHVEKVFGDIGTLGVVTQDELGNGTKARRHRLEEAILGIGSNSAKIDANLNYTLGGCRALDACRAFRKRVFTSFGFSRLHQ